MSAALSQEDGRTPQVAGELLATRRVGAYHHLTFLAPAIAAIATPGQFVAIAVGGDTSANLLRRCFSIHQVSPGDSGDSGNSGNNRDSGDGRNDRDGRENGGTVDVIVAARGPGTRWLTDLRTRDEVNLIGPLGNGFPLPTEPVPCVLVGGGYGSAPLFWLASVLRERGCHVEMVLGAASKDRLFGVVRARRTRGAVEGVTITTDDGSMGVRGWVSTVLPDVIRHSRAKVVYGCGPMAMLKSITDTAAAEGAVAQVAVEESMACGIGVCMTCVMPVAGTDGLTRMARTCVEGPVFRGDQIRWEAFDNGRCQVPEDAYGATAMRGH